MKHSSMPDLNSLPDTAMQRANSVRALFDGISRHTLERWVKAGILPTPTMINGVKYWQVGQLREALQRLTEPSQPDSQVQA